MGAFFSGFEDELSKLAQARPSRVRGTVRFNEAKWKKMRAREAAALRRRREFKEKGGSGLESSKKGPWVSVPPPADKPAPKKRRRAKAKPSPQPVAKAKSVTSWLARGAKTISRAGAGVLRGKAPGRARPPSGGGAVPPAPRPHRYSITPRESPTVFPRPRRTVVKPVPKTTAADRSRTIVSKIVSKKYTGLPAPKSAPIKPGGVD